MRKAYRVTFVVFAVVLSFTGGAFAAAYVQDWFEADTDRYVTSTVNAVYSRTGFFFNDNQNQFRTYGGNDVFNMGDGSDHYSMGNGTDVIALGGSGNALSQSGDIITFDVDGNSVSSGYADSRNYIKSSYMPETIQPGVTGILEMRAYNVWISSNVQGDVVVKLGNPL